MELKGLSFETEDSSSQGGGTRMERHASCSAWDEDHETDDVMAEVLTRSASAAQREARELLPPPFSQTSQPET